MVTTSLVVLGSVFMAMLTAVGGMVGYLIKQNLTSGRANQDAMEKHRTSLETALEKHRTSTETALEKHRTSTDKALAGIRTEMTTLRTEMTTLRTSVDTSLAGIRTEMTEMRAELKEEIGKVYGKVEYLNRRVNGLQSDVSYIRGRLFVTDEELPEGSKASRTPGPASL